MTTPIRIAIGSVPKASGTFTFYRNLRGALQSEAFALHCVAVGAEQARLWNDAYADAGCVLLAPTETALKRQSEVFTEWCFRERIDIVIGINAPAILAALPHLPENIRCVARCANAFDHGYRLTMLGGDRLAAIVATTPRLVRDLCADYAAPSAKVHLIPNGADPRPRADSVVGSRAPADPLQLGFLGRLEHGQKGVFHLPAIVDELERRAVAFHLRIAGKGVHGRALKRRLARAVQHHQVTFLGALSPDEAPRFLAETDVFVFPSHFEGCPNVLIEAMMAGCVPVCWRIEGITDFIVTDGQSGFICPSGDAIVFAGRIASLAADRSRLAGMRAAAAEDARARFSSVRMAEAYATLFRRVMAAPPPPWRPVPWDRFCTPTILRAPIRGRLSVQARRLAWRILYGLRLSERWP